MSKREARSQYRKALHDLETILTGAISLVHVLEAIQALTPEQRTLARMLISELVAARNYAQDTREVLP